MEEQHVENSENSEKSLKRKREPSVFDNFTKLANGQEKVRIKGGVELIKHLTDNENEEKSDDELKYALGRLVRGLGAAKIQTKTGFFTALVALLNLKNVTIEELLEHVTKELHKGGSNSKSENADICSGQILVMGAILRSNLYDRASEEDKKKVLEVLVNAGKQRNYLNLASYKFLADLYNKIDAKEFEKVVFPIIKPELTKSWQEQDLDSLYLLVETQNHFPNVIKTKFLKNNLGTAEIVCSESLPQLCSTLTTIPRVLALKHPIFDLFIKKLSNSELIVQFFETLDTTLSKSNRNKYFVAIKLLTGVLEHVQDPMVIPDLLTKNFIQQTINTYKTAVGKLKDHEFQQHSQKLFETLVNCLKKEGVKSKIQIRVIKKLMFYPGTFIFEKITKSKLIQNITAILNVEGVKKLASIYAEVVLASSERTIDENTTERWWNMDRIYASHLLAKLLNHPSMHDENDWKTEQLTLLMDLGIKQNDSVGQELADSFKETFYSSLDLKLSKLDDLRYILSKLVNHLDQCITEDNLDTVLRQPIKKGDYDTWKETTQLCNKLESKSQRKKIVFHILFLHLGLQIFNNSKLASDSLKELFSCYERVKKSKREEAEANSDDPLWIEVVIDLFLNLLSHSSHLLRSVINCVFPHLCKYMNATAIHQILSVLDPKNQSNPLSKPGEDESDDEGEDDDEESSQGEEEEEDDDDDEDDTVNDKLRMALQQALGANVDEDAESVDLDDLDEDEGEKLDEALSQAFKQFKPNLGKKKKQNKDEETLTHFRIRVVDLIEIYLNSNPSMLLTLEIMLPLLQTLEFSIRDDHQRPLQDRVRHCLKKLSSLKKFNEFEEVDDKVLVDLLKSLLDKGTKNAIIIQDMGEKIAECCIFIINCSQIINQGERSKIVKVLKKGLEAFFKKRDCLIPYGLFKGVIQLNWEGIVDLVPLLTSFVFNTSIRPFRRSQAIELLKIFANNNRFINGHEEVVKSLEEVVSNFIASALEFFREFSTNPSEKKVKEKFLCNLFELLTCLKGSTILSKGFSSWDILGQVVRDCRSQISLSKDSKQAFNRLCNSLSISNVVKMKDTTIKLSNLDEEVNGKVEKQEEKKRKKSMNKEKRKLKKESKQLRLQSLSEGLGKRKLNWEGVEEESKKVKTS